MSRGTILIVEDDRDIRAGLADALESDGYRAATAADGKQGLALARQQPFDLILLDIMMPGLSGYDVCREIRRRDAVTPILMLTAKGGEVDKVVGLELGADDYITKPFGVRELLARVAAALRRRRAREAPRDDLPDELAFGAARINRKTYRGRRGKIEFAIPAREMRLIEEFVRHPDEALSRDRLLNDVWGVDYGGTTRTLDQHVAQLRKKIERTPDAPAVLLTVHGVGYRYQPAPGAKNA